jgi:hypothetical protein
MATITHTTNPTGGTMLHAVRNAGAVVIGIFLAMHGIAHSLAFFVQWQITHPKGISYSTSLFYGHLDVGNIGIRIDGLLWLLAGAAFVAVGLRLAWLRRLEAGSLLAVSLFSLALCVLGLGQSIVGMWIDVAVLASLMVRSVLLHTRARVGR